MSIDPVRIRRRRHLLRPLAASVSLATASIVVLAATAAVAAPRDNGPVTTAAVGAAPSLPAGATLTTPVATATPLQLTVVLQPSDPTGMAALAARVSDPASADYRHYLAPGAFGPRFGPSPATVQAVTDALSGLGFHPGPVSSNRLAIAIRTTAGQAASAFGVRLTTVKLAGGGLAYTNTAAPKLPATVASSVMGILGLDNLNPARPLDHATLSAPAKAPTTSAPATLGVAQATAPQPCAAAIALRGSPDFGYTADQMAAAYSLGGFYSKGVTGAGVTVAIFELAGYDPADIAAYQSCYGTTAPLANVSVDGGPNPSDPGSGEAVLDIEGVIGIAPKATIVVYQGPNGSPGIFDTYNRAVADDTAKIITTSWGNCEAFSTATSAENTLFQQAALQGQTILAAAGDAGSEDCSPHNSTALAVDNPASQPFVTGVGGTALKSISPHNETVWNDAGGGATGGGLSVLWPRPAYQHGPGVVNVFSNGFREVPDVSASASPNNGYIIYYTGTDPGAAFGWQTVGGTSPAAPLWAAFLALTDEGCGCSVGFVNPLLYNVAALGPGAFNDVTVGNNDSGNLHGGAYPATPGYDMATGLGTPIGGTLAPYLNTRAAFTYPTNGQTNVDTTRAFTWAPVVFAEGYAVIVGTTRYGGDLFYSGSLPPGQTAVAVPAFPIGQTLWATLFTKINGTYSFQDIAFTAAPGMATFTYPINGQLNVDSTQPFTWAPIPAAQGYILVVGTTVYGSDLVNSGILPPGQTSYAVPPLPANKLLLATLLTKVNGAWTRFQLIGFTAAPAMATFTYPVNGQTNVTNGTPFTWTNFPAAQNYILVVGTTIYGSDLVNSGILPAGQTSYSVPALPTARVLYATLLTKVNGTWTFQLIGFIVQ